MFLDVDYYALQPKIASDLKTYVSEFLGRAKDIQARIIQDLSNNQIRSSLSFSSAVHITTQKNGTKSHRFRNFLLASADSSLLRRARLRL